MLNVCQHCGDAHSGLPVCPRTGDPMSALGRCGTKVDRYVVERLLGTGAFGAVYQARHVRTEAKVALKILKRELMTETATLERFMREARAAAAVGDDHVVRVLDAEVTEGNVAFIAMELLDGMDLKELNRRERPLHPTRLVHLMAQALDGLATAHEKGVVHRDMKPANIFVVRRTEANGREVEFSKILDFGISKMDTPGLVNPLTIAGATLGTPNYMAWEQFFDARQVDARTDLYAVSVILYELLGGKKPYEGDGLADLIAKVRVGGAPPLRALAPALPVPLCAVIDKGLATKRERRWQTAKEYAAALRQAARLTGEPPPLAPRVKEPEREYRTEPVNVAALAETAAKVVDPERKIATAVKPDVVPQTFVRTPAVPVDTRRLEVERKIATAMKQEAVGATFVRTPAAPVEIPKTVMRTPVATEPAAPPARPTEPEVEREPGPGEAIILEVKIEREGVPEDETIQDPSKRKP